MATLVCGHSTTILTNREHSELVDECIFYALQVRTRTLQENCHSEIFFTVYSITTEPLFYCDS